MEFFDLFKIFLIQLAASLPALAFWIALLVLGTWWRRRGGGRAERFLVAGAGIKLGGTLLGTLSSVITIWLTGGGYDLDYIGRVNGGYGILLSVVNMAGILCLVYAFWLKFTTSKTEANGASTLERGSHDTVSE